MQIQYCQRKESQQWARGQSLSCKGICANPAGFLEEELQFQVPQALFWQLVTSCSLCGISRWAPESRRFPWQKALALMNHHAPSFQTQISFGWLNDSREPDEKRGHLLKFGFKPAMSFLCIVYCVWMCFQHEVLLLIVYKELFHQLL